MTDIYALILLYIAINAILCPIMAGYYAGSKKSSTKSWQYLVGSYLFSMVTWGLMFLALYLHW